MASTDKGMNLAVFPGSSRGRLVAAAIKDRFAQGKLGAGVGGLVDVVGDENRARETRTDKPPFRMICSIEIAFGNETPVAAGTGWLVGQRTVVTAAHVLWWDGKVAKVRVVPGRNGLDPTRPAFESSTFHFHPRWTGRIGDHAEWDIAAIRLPEPIGRRIGWFGVLSMPDDRLEQCLINIAGYPKSVTGNSVDPCKELWFEVNNIDLVQPQRIFYGLDTSPGQSGAPVMLWPNPLAPKGPPTVVGVHARGLGGSGALNSATRINDEKLGLLGGWVAADNAGQ